MTRQRFEHILDDAAMLLGKLRNDDKALGTLVLIAGQIAKTYKRGGKVLACGNGGSMADAMHFAEEWTGRFRNDRIPYPALAPSDATHITCVGNDYGFDQIFARWIKALGRSGDMLILLSTSGRSPNLLRAAEAAREAGVQIVGFLGRDGGPLLELCDVALIVPGDTSDRIQELHMLCLHALIEMVESELDPTGQ